MYGKRFNNHYKKTDFKKSDFRHDKPCINTLQPQALEPLQPLEPFWFLVTLDISSTCNAKKTCAKEIEDPESCTNKFGPLLIYMQKLAPEFSTFTFRFILSIPSVKFSVKNEVETNHFCL